METTAGDRARRGLPLPTASSRPGEAEDTCSAGRVSEARAPGGGKPMPTPSREGSPSSSGHCCFCFWLIE